jgi:hypothetical protein
LAVALSRVFVVVVGVDRGALTCTGCGPLLVEREDDDLHSVDV